jgi:hypothetical protein
MAVERMTLDLPPELKYWLDTQVQQRKAAGERKATLKAVVVGILEQARRQES